MTICRQPIGEALFDACRQPLPHGGRGCFWVSLPFSPPLIDTASWPPTSFFFLFRTQTHPSMHLHIPTHAHARTHTPTALLGYSALFIRWSLANFPPNYALCAHARPHLPLTTDIHSFTHTHTHASTPQHTALLGYSALFIRWSLAIFPPNYALCACHITNFSAQAVQFGRYYKYVLCAAVLWRACVLCVGRCVAC